MNLFGKMNLDDIENKTVIILTGTSNDLFYMEYWPGNTLRSI